MDALDLFERYLHAVRKYLPWQRQDDIIAELRANLEAQREEREAELGRPLTEGEMIDWLKELGPPMEMAARYQAPRYLIGPAIFPLYWYILRIVLAVASAVYVAANIGLAFAQPHETEWIFHVIFNWPMFLVMPAAWVTVAFVVLEFLSERYPEKCPDFLAMGPRWSPASLPPVEKQPPAASKPRTFIAAMAEFVVEWALLLWLLLIPHYPFLLLGPGVVILRSIPIRFAPAVEWFYWSLIAFNVLQLAWQGYELLSNRWRMRGQAQKLIIKACGMVPLLVLFAAPGHIYLEHNPAGSGQLPNGLTVTMLNHSIYLGVTALTLMVIVQFLWEIWKTTSRARHQPSTVLL